MKKKTVLLSILILLAIPIVVGVMVVASNDSLKTQFSDKVEELRARLRFKIQKSKLSKENQSMQHDYMEEVALHFRDGSVIVGKLLGETQDEYRIEYKGEETIVFAGMVDSITSPEEKVKDWDYKNDVVVKLKNKTILDAEISKVDEAELVLLYPMEEGGVIEQVIERSKVDHLIFKPVSNKESMDIENSLKELFPKMEFYREGNFTIITDSHITWVKLCKKTLRKVCTDIYLEFFDVFKNRKPQLQNFVVIFDDYGDFVEYAIADGVPGWAVAGYFSPEDKVLYLFNLLGEQFSKILFEGIVGESGRSIDDIVDNIEGVVDKRYHVFVEGQAKQIKDKFWTAYSYYENRLKRATLSTVRHEFTHSLFHNWGLQSIILSKFEGMDKESIKKKKEFLETKDYKKKAEVLRTLATQRSDDVPLDIKSANSWLAEGIATYCETQEIGEQNDIWLYIYQEMARKGPVYPIEFLTAYKIGSFPGVYSRAMADLYAQSWAFVSFLMERYRKEFMRYQDKLATEDAKEADDVRWLLEELGKDSKTIQDEFIEYMNKFEELEDPYIVHFMKMHDFFSKY